MFRERPDQATKLRIKRTVMPRGRSMSTVKGTLRRTARRTTEMVRSANSKACLNDPTTMLPTPHSMTGLPVAVGASSRTCAINSVRNWTSAISFSGRITVRASPSLDSIRRRTEAGRSSSPTGFTKTARRSQASSDCSCSITPSCQRIHSRSEAPSIATSSRRRRIRAADMEEGEARERAC